MEAPHSGPVMQLHLRCWECRTDDQGDLLTLGPLDALSVRPDDLKEAHWLQGGAAATDIHPLRVCGKSQ